jgi:transposase-like protein
VTAVKYTFKQFQAQFPDDASCLLSVMHSQYGGTYIHCPSCGVEQQFHPMAERRGFAGQDCGHHIYPCAGTIFHKSSTKLANWFFAMYLMTSTRHGVAAKELERQIGCTYKTAWRMAHELRKLMAATNADRSGGKKLTGHVEVDETFVGGRSTGRGHARKFDNKSIVFGMLERGGDVIAGVVQNRGVEILQGTIIRNVEKGSRISSDEHRSYMTLGRKGFYHRVVNHHEEIWTDGDTHTNSIEGHWSQLKRSIRGTHIHVSAKHLWKYICEFSYRRNMRSDHRAMFDLLVIGLSLPRLAET